MKHNPMRRSRLVLVSAVLLLVLLASSLALAQDSAGGFTALGLSPDGAPIDVAKPATDGPSAQRAGIDPNDLKTVSVIVTLDESVSADAVAALTGGEVIHRYDKVFNGASLVLDGSNVDALAAIDGVTGVYLDTLQQLDTEASPQFIGAPTAWNALGGQGSAGEGVVVGILDSGIWPEHPSMSDPDPFGKPYDPPAITPAECDFGNTAANPADAPFTCNNKLIGAYNMLDTYKALVGLMPTEFDSARDDNGHGTHTATTAAGNGGVAASIFGVPYGYASGIAPRAHVIAYRVCGDAGCYGSDSVAAVNQAIIDGVDVINFSISGGANPYSDAVELAFANAYDNGVFVAASAGNSGPTPETVAHRGPWTTTVAASTSDRHFTSTLTVTADNGDSLVLTGVTITDGILTPTPVVKASPIDCNNAAAPGTYSGKIVICSRGVIARVMKGFNVLQGGAAGMILYNPSLQGLSTDNHYLPSIHIEFPDGGTLVNFVDTHTGVMATFTPGTATTVQGDVMAAFSSRGGPGQSLGISKPDITAPGVQILAGHTPMPATEEGGPAGELFQAIQGTSMSSPHIAGAAAIVAAQNPDWTPGQIKSALMTTAQGGVVKEDGSTAATPFDTGSGRVNLARAGWAQLTFDETVANYFAHQNDLWHANYPSLYVPELAGSLTVERTVQDQTGKKSTWQLSVYSDPGLTVTVPKKIKVPANGEVTFPITVSAPTVPLGEVRHAQLRMKSGYGTLIFPITIVRGQAVVEIEKACAPNEIRIKEDTNCTITLTNTGSVDAAFDLRDLLPKQLRLRDNSVVGGTQIPGTNGVQANGVLAGAAPPDVDVAIVPLGSPAGFIPLGGFGGTSNTVVGDESIVNFNVPQFLYAGEVYTRIGATSNGYAVVGGGTGADVQFINTNLPNATPPNNVLAPFWTDLNGATAPSGAGIKANVLTDGSNQWLILEWDRIPNYSSAAQVNSFQIWIGLLGDASNVEDISFTYGTVTGGDGGFLTVGAENRFGNRGGTVYFDGVGTAPTPSNSTGYDVLVSSTPPADGGVHTLSFKAFGKSAGNWTNCAEMTSDVFEGTAMACATGRVLGRGQ